MEDSSITCRTCQAKNTPHNKYCYNCGSRLPAASHIVCPNCKTLNPGDRYYCDECGVRLLEEGQAAGTGELSSEDTVLSNSTAFTLPAREPGDTGELDPASLLARMKHDELAPEAQAGIDEEEPLPDASELLSRKTSTADLPEWLVDEYDSDPIIDAPGSISTDDYLEMLGRAKEQDITAVDHDHQLGDQIDLPSWLDDADLERQRETPGVDQTALDPDLSSWLAELSETTTGDSPDMEEPSNDWLSELGPANTDLLSRPGATGPVQTGDLEADEESLPDWLGELGPPDTDILSAPSEPEKGSAEEQASIIDELSDWMSDLGPPDTEFLSTPSSSALATPEEEEFDDVLSDDWMADLRPPDTSMLALEADVAQDEWTTDVQGDESSSEWLAELGPPNTDMLNGRKSAELFLPDQPDADEQEPPDWMSELGPPETSYLQESAGLSDVVLESLDQSPETPEEWLWETDEASDQPDHPEPDDAGQGFEPGEFDTVGAIESDGPEEEFVPAWLSDDDMPEMGTLPDQLPTLDDVESTGSLDELEDLSGWLFDVDQPSDSELREVGSEGSDAESAGIGFEDDLLPSWLTEGDLIPDEEADRDVTASASTPEAEGFEPPDALPEWLAMDEEQADEEAARDATASASTPAAEGFEPSDALPEWLAIDEEQADEETARDVTASASTPAAEGFEPPDALPEWLAMDEEQADEEAARDVTASASTPEAVGFEPPDALPEWLAIDEEQADEEAASDVTASASTPEAVGFEPPDALPEWLAMDEEQAEIDDAERAPRLEPATADDAEGMLAFDDVVETDSGETTLETTEVAQAPPAFEESGSPGDESTSWDSEADALEMEAQLDEDAVEADELLEGSTWPEPDLPLDESAGGEDVDSFAELLADIGTAELQGGDELAGDSLSELFEDEGLAQETELEWMTAPLVLPEGFGDAEEEPEAPEEAAVGDAGRDRPMEAVAPEGESAYPGDETLLEEPDWLSELESMGLEGVVSDTGALAEFEAEEAPAPVDTPLVDGRFETADLRGPEPSATRPLSVEPVKEREQEAELGPEDEILSDLGPVEALPDWLGELGPPPAGQQAEPSVIEELISSGELPEWISDLKPEADSETESLLPRAMSDGVEDEEAILELGDDLDDAELPDWLQSEVGVESGDKAASSLLGALTPDLFRRERREPESESGLKVEESSDLGSEWGDVLSALPPSRRPDEDLVRAEIPDWLRQLKPRELIEHGTEREMKLPAVVSGPLAGLKGVIGIEPIIDLPHSASGAATFAVTKEQQQQAALLRRLTQWEIRPSVVPVRQASASPTWLRTLLVIALFMSVILGLSMPDLLLNEPAPLTEEARLANEAISAAAGHSVLVALDYTPALSGELSPLAGVLLERLEENGSQILTVSQSAAGAAIAADLMSQREGHDLGYMPGETIALRQLADCLASGRSCHRLFGRELSTEQQQALVDVSLVILVTGDRDSLVAWIEQVAASSDVPVMAGITQSLGPVARPYASSGQLRGLLASLEGTAAFQDTYLQDVAAEGLPTQLGALQIVQLSAAVIMLVGAIVYGITAGGRKRTGTRGEGT